MKREVSKKEMTPKMKLKEEGSKEEHKVRRKDDSTRQRKASGVFRPRINSTTEEEIEEVGEPQDIKNLIKNDGADINQLDPTSEEDRKTEQSRRGKTMGVGRPRINSHLAKTEEEELDTKTNGSDANNFNKVEISNNLMNEITTKESTKKESEESGVRVPNR